MGKIYLSNEDIYSIINQMEVTLSTKAADLADIIFEKRVRAEQRAYESLKDKVIGATTKMTADLEYSTDINLSETDMLALNKVTEGLRELGYKFRFIEIQNPAGETLSHKLHISILHLAGEE